LAEAWPGLRPHSFGPLCVNQSTPPTWTQTALKHTSNITRTAPIKTTKPSSFSYKVTCMASQSRLNRPLFLCLTATVPSLSSPQPSDAMQASRGLKPLRQPSGHRHTVAGLGMSLVRQPFQRMGRGVCTLQCHGSLFPLWRAFTCFRPPSPSQPPRYVSPRPLPHTHRPEPEPECFPPEASHEREFVSWRPFAPLVANPAPVEPHDDCWLNGRRRHARITLAAVTQNGFCSWYTSASPLFGFPRFTFSPYLLHSASHVE